MKAKHQQIKKRNAKKKSSHKENRISQTKKHNGSKKVYHK